MESKMATTDTRELVSLLEQQRRVYVKLRLLADRQGALVVNEDTQPLLGLLMERQRLVDSLVSLNERLAPYRASWTAIYAGMDELERRHVASLLEESNTALGTIINNDNRDTATLEARRQSMAAQLGHADTAARANAAYVSRSGSKTALTDAVA